MAGSEVVCEEGSLQNADGKKLFTKFWKPKEKQPCALVFISHGFGEHCLRYERLGNALASQGYLAFTHDHIGHGQSEGERVQVSSFSCYVRDVFQHIDDVTANNPGIPIFMFGHSMGGTIAILSVMGRPDFFTGAIFSAPGIKVDPDKTNSCKMFFGNILAWIAPSFQIVPAIDPAVLSRDPEEVQKYASDPLVWHEGLKVKWVTQMLEAMDDIQTNSPNVKTPFLLLHGDDDQIVTIEGSTLLHEKSQSKDKTFKVYKDCRHEILNELKEDADAALKDILDWIKQRLP